MIMDHSEGISHRSRSPRLALYVYKDTKAPYTSVRDILHIEVEESPFLFRLARHDAQFASAVAASSVSYRIDIHLADNTRHSERHVAVLVQSIEAKGWRSCTEEGIRQTWSPTRVYRTETLRPTLQGPSPDVRVPSLYGEK